jgi:hypothetical protein
MFPPPFFAACRVAPLSIVVLQHRTKLEALRGLPRGAALRGHNSRADSFNTAKINFFS